MIRQHLDWVAEASYWIFADAFEIEIAVDEVGERAGQQHVFTQCFGQGRRLLKGPEEFREVRVDLQKET